MQVTLKEQKGIHRQLGIEIPAEKIDPEVEKRLKKIAKTAKIDGFRPGKVPVSFIRRKYGEQVRQEVLSDLLPNTYQQAIQDHGLQAVGVEIDMQQNETGKPVVFDANVEVLPEMQIDDLSQMQVENPVVEFGDQQVEQMVHNLRKQLATWHDVTDRPAQQDDKVKVDFTGYVDGETFDGGQGQDVELTLGSGQMIADFEQGIEGMTVGQEKTIAVEFPEDYNQESLAGKAAEFKVTLNSIQAPELPEIDEAFVAKLDIKGGVDDFYHEIKENMARELNNAKRRKMKDSVFEALSNHVDVQLPKALVQREIKNAKQDLLKRMGGQNAQLNVDDLPDNLFEEQAKSRVKLGLIMNHLIDTQAFEADDESVNAMIEEMAAVYEDADEFRQHIQSNEKELEQIKNAVIENKLVDWVMSQAQVQDKEHDFFELVRQTMPQQQQ